MSIYFTKNSNVCVNRALVDSIQAIAKAYCESGMLHIGYAVRLKDVRESHYIPDCDALPTIVICSIGDEVTDIRCIYADEESEVITELKAKYIG